MGTTTGPHRLTGVVGLLALVLSIMSSRALQPDSILLDEIQQTAPAPEPILPGLGDPPPGGEETTGEVGELPPPGGSGEDAGSDSGEA